MTRRRVIDLGHDLPPRAAPPEADALTKVFGGCQAPGNVCELVGGVPKCCPGFVCMTFEVYPWLTEKKCVAA